MKSALIAMLVLVGVLLVRPGPVSPFPGVTLPRPGPVQPFI